MEQSDLATHMYKKRKTIYTDEFEVYFNEPPTDFGMNILGY